MNAQLEIARIEPRVSPDPTSRPDWLLTKMDGDHVEESMRYSDADVVQYGIDRVRTWIAEDQRRYDAWQRDDWSFIDLRLVAVVEVQAAEQRVGTLQIDGPVLGGIESDAGDDYMQEVVGELAAEFRSELAARGFTGLDAIVPADIANEP